MTEKHEHNPIHHDQADSHADLETRLRAEAEAWRKQPSADFVDETLRAIEDHENSSVEIAGQQHRPLKMSEELARQSWQRHAFAFAASFALLLAGGSYWLGPTLLKNNQTTSPPNASAIGSDVNGNGVLHAVVFEPLGEAWQDANQFLASATPSLEAEAAVWCAELKSIEHHVRQRLPWPELRGSAVPQVNEDAIEIKAIEDQ